MAEQKQSISQRNGNEDSAPLPAVLKWKKELIIENDLRFDPANCGPGLFISDENTVLKKNVDLNQWVTCRIMNAGWDQGIHYWSMRLVDRGSNGHIMLGIVLADSNTGLVQYPGETNNSYGFNLHQGYKYHSATPSAFVLDLPKSNDVIGFLLDLDSRTLTYFKNGQILGTAFGQLPLGSGIKYYPAIGLHELGGWVSLIKTVK